MLARPPPPGGGAATAAVVLSFLALLLLAAFGLALYWAPSFIGWRRHVPDLKTIVLLNLFLGWTVVAWGIALFLAVRPLQDTAPPIEGRPPIEAPPQWYPRERG
jgi:hypothetical protein